MKSMNESKIITLISNKQCNNSCRICARSQMKIDELDFAEVREMLRALRESNHTDLILTGGEATLRDDLLDIIKLSKEMGFLKLHLQTNGRKFSDLEFAKNVVSGNENFIDIFLSIHGHTALIHEEITRIPGSFEETSLGIENLISLNIPIRTNTVIAKPNYQLLYEITDFLLTKGVRTIQLSFVHPIGAALENQETMVPDIRETIPYVRKALRRNSKEIRVLTEAIPFCLLEEDYIHAAEALTSKITGAEDVSKIRGEECKECSHNPICPGIWKRYHTLKGFAFQPVKKN